MGDRLRLGCAVQIATVDYEGEICALNICVAKCTCKDGFSRMSDLPPSDCSGRQVPPRRVRPLVDRQRAQPRSGGSDGQTPRWRLLMGSRLRATSPDAAALTRPLTHRKRLQQRGHFCRQRRVYGSPTVAMVPLTMSDNSKTGGRTNVAAEGAATFK